MTMPGLKTVTAMKEGNTNLLPKSVKSFQSGAKCNSPTFDKKSQNAFLGFSPAWTKLKEMRNTFFFFFF